MKNFPEVNRFFDDYSFRDVLLFEEYQNDLLSTDSINELKKISYIVRWIIEQNSIINLLNEVDYNNLLSFKDKVSNSIKSILDSFNENIVSASDLTCYKDSESSRAFLRYLESFQFEKNVDLCVDLIHKTLMIYSIKWELIWEIWQSKYDDSYFITNNHLYNVVEEKFRWKGWWINLYNAYTNLHGFDNSFILPKIDYTNVVSMVEVYKKFWFKIVSKLVYWLEESIEWDDILLLEKIKQDYKNWKKERKLDFSIKIEK